MTTPRIPGRILAWTALLVALAASVGANVAQARPEAGPRLTAAVAPTLVILASGMLERVSVRAAAWWQRWLVIGGLVFVVSAAFVTSFQHQYELLVRYGNETLSAVLLPLAIDALIVMASVCLAVIAERRRHQLDEAAQVDDESDDPDTASDSDPDTSSDGEQRQRGGKRQHPKQRAIRLYRNDPNRSAAQIAETLQAAGHDISARTVARWLEPHRPSGRMAREVAGEPDPVSVGA